jgi:hypothetical protein
VGILAAGDVPRIDLKFWAAFVQVRDDDFGPWQVEVTSAGDISEHEIEHSGHQQWYAEHENHSEGAAKGAGYVFERYVYRFHEAILIA